MRVQRRLGAAVSAGALVLLAAGCGGATAGQKTSEGKAAPAAPAEPLPVKSTPKPATWTDTGDQRHPLRVGPKKLARGAASDMAHIRLDDELKGMVPYYLTFSFTNTGKDPVKGVDPTRNFSVNTADGQAAHAISLFQSNPLATGSGLPADCREAGRADLAAGDTTAICQIFMLPKGQVPATVSYKDDGSDTLLWQVGGAKSGGSGVLGADEPADSVTQDSSRHDVTVHITPKSVRPGSVADLSHFDLDADEKKLIPYYVTMEYRNSGKYDLLPDLNENVVVRTAGGQESKRMILLNIGGPGVGQCPDAVPNRMLKPGAKVTSCSIHMLAKGDHPAAVVFQGKGGGSRPVTWRAAAAEAAAASDADK
jgi:hypothetical protein